MPVGLTQGLGQISPCPSESYNEAEAIMAQSSLECELNKMTHYVMPEDAVWRVAFGRHMDEPASKKKTRMHTNFDI